MVQVYKDGGIELLFNYFNIKTMKNLILVFVLFTQIINAQTIFEFNKIESINSHNKKLDKVNGTIEINIDSTFFKLKFLGKETIEKISLYSYNKYSDTDEDFFYEIDNQDKELFSVFYRNKKIYLIIIQSRLNTYRLKFS
jgi:hypothetical protein